MAATSTIAVGGRQIAVHKADKQLYPGVTKSDVVAHVGRASPARYPRTNPAAAKDTR